MSDHRLFRRCVDSFGVKDLVVYSAIDLSQKLSERALICLFAHAFKLLLRIL